MAKVFKCRYKGKDCDFAFYGDTDEEIIEQAYPHAQSAHQCPFTREEFGEYIRDAIRNERRVWLPWARHDANA